MAGRIRRNGGNGLDAWPGYVDALSTLLMVIIFVLLVFVLAQAFLTVTLSGRSHQLDKANQQLAALTDALSLERGKSADLQLSVSQLGKQLAARAAERDRLGSQLADANAAIQEATAANARLQSQLTNTAGQADAAKAQLADAQTQLAEMKKQIADLDRTVAVDKDTLQAKLSDLATLANQSRALEALRDDLEKQAQDAAAKVKVQYETQPNVVEIADAPPPQGPPRIHYARGNADPASITCAPSGSTTVGSTGSSPTNCLRSARFISGRDRDRLPTKSPFDRPIVQPRPRSSGITVPSVSWPTTM